MKNFIFVLLLIVIANTSWAQCGGVGTINNPPIISNVTATSLTLTWDSATPRNYYEIAYGTTPATPNVISNIVGTTTHNFSSLTPGNTYYFQVYVVRNCINAEGDQESQESVSPMVSTILKPPAPAATAVPAADITSSSFVARWAQANGASNYRIQVSTDNFNTILTGYNGKLINGGATLNTNVTGINANTDYSFRLWSENASGSSGFSNTVSVKTHVTEPVTQASNLSFGALSETSLTINCTAGSGTERLIIVRQGTPITFNPLDGSSYIVNSNFAAAIDQGSGHKAVYRGNANTVTITGLALNTTYHVKVFEFNGTGQVTNYLTSAATGNPAIVSSLMTSPTTQATAMTFSAFTPTSLNGDFTAAAGNPNGYIVLQRQGASPTGVPADGTTYVVGNTIGDATVVAVGNSTSFSRNGLLANIEYHYDVYTYNGAGLAINYFTTNPLEGSRTTLATEPAVQATALTFTSLAPTSVQLNFTAAAGTPSGYLVLRRQGNSPTGAPVDGTAYAIGNAIGDGTVIAVGNETSVASATLNPNTIYHYDVIAFNGAGQATNYLTTAPLENSRTTLATEPTAQATGLDFSLHTVSTVRVNFNAAVGSPTGYLVIRKTGSASTGVPVDGTTYNVNGALDGTIVSIGNTTQIDNAALLAGTVYHYTVFSYNGNGAAINYRTTSPHTGSTIMLPDFPQGFATSENHANDIKVSWQAVTGATEYELLVSTSQDFTQPVLNYNPKIIDDAITNHVVVGLTPSTVYYFKIRARNDSGPSERYSNIESASTLSGGGTDVLNFADLDFDESHLTGQQQDISIKTLGGIGAVTVDFYHKKISETDFAKISVPETNDEYTLSVSETWFDDFGLEFYFEVRDQANQTKTTPQHVVLKQISNVIVPVSSFGKSIKNYHIISIPYTVSGSTIRDVFERKMGTYDKKEWRLSRYQNNRIVDFENGLGASPPEQGQGYWFISKNEVTLDFGKGTSYEVVTPFVMELKAGWNQIGNPFPFHVNWQDVLDDNGNPAGVGKLIVFDEEFKESDLLKVFEGGFVFADQDTELEFKPTLPKATDGFTGGRIASDDVNNNDYASGWMLPIGLTQGEKINHFCGIGMHFQAAEGKDDFDRITIPRFADYLEFNSHHDNYPFKFSRSIVPLQTDYSWDFTIESNSDEPVKMNWSKQHVSELGAQVILYDETRRIVLDMSKIDSYETVSSANVRIFFATEKRSDVVYTELGRPYPNPFHQELTIPYNYAWDGSSMVHIAILDVSGRQIWERTFYEEANKNVQEIKWSGETRDGNQAASGMYVYKVLVTSGNRKIAFNGKVIKN